MRLLALVVLASCSSSSRPFSLDDRTPCGLYAAGDSATQALTWATGDVLREAEVAVLDAIATHTAISRDYACRQWVGLSVYTNAQPCWRDAKGDDWCGVAYCNHRSIVVGTPPHGGDWRRSTLAHELLHVVQGCHAPLPVDDGMDATHADWARSGINAALVALQGDK